MLIAGLIALVYIFSDANWIQKISFFMFALPFSWIFKLSTEQTSLFIIFRVALVFAYAFQQGKRFDSKFLIVAIMTFAYCALVSEILHTEYAITAINLMLWIFVGYVIVNTVSPKEATPVVRSLSNSIILTGILGLLIGDLPQMKVSVKIATAIVGNGIYVNRYAGFMPDPNFFTVLVIAALCFIYIEFNFEKISVSEFFVRCATMSFLGLMTMSKSCAILLIVFWVYVIIAKNNIKISSKVILSFSLLIALMLFAWRNPYWLSDITYRFTQGNDEFSADIFTTGRSEIWKLYQEKITDGLHWIYGYGLGAEFLDGKAPHNTIIQLLYNLGVVGSVLVIAAFRTVYTSAIFDIRCHKVAKLSKYAFIVLLSTLFFLDGLHIELFHYMTAMCFVYMKGNSNENISLSTSNVGKV